MEENKNISIKGDETIEELVKKVTTVESIDDKLDLCQTIIIHLEMKNSVRIGSYSMVISLTKKYPPIDPRENMDDFNFDINLFLFLLKDTDADCYLKLQEIHKKLSNKEDSQDQLMMTGMIVGIIVVIYLMSSYFNSI
tara:strand:- start:198 stop:611 length:414 start_codon:yes stop_codon:yes gene_type:complete